jgi:Holliday junction resolvasome RuvABC endonuclease subunit
MNQVPTFRERRAPELRLPDAFLQGAVPCAHVNAQRPVLGLDGSVNKIGFAIIWGRYIKAWKWTAKSTGIQRMFDVQKVVNDVLAVYRPVGCAIEGYAMGAKGRTHATGECGGIHRMVVASRNIPIIEVAPGGLKKFVSGKGDMPKTGMPLALYKSYGVDYPDEDQADASGLALMAAARFGGHERKLFAYQEVSLKAAGSAWPHVTK